MYEKGRGMDKSLSLLSLVRGRTVDCVVVVISGHHSSLSCVDKNH